MHGISVVRGAEAPIRDERNCKHTGVACSESSDVVRFEVKSDPQHARLRELHNFGRLHIHQSGDARHTVADFEHVADIGRNRFRRLIAFNLLAQRCRNIFYTETDKL